MKTKQASKKQIDAAIEFYYVKHAKGKQINIMKMGQVFKDALLAVTTQAERAPGPVNVAEVLDAVMPEIVARYCEPA